MKTEWIKTSDRLPGIGEEYNVVWDMEDGGEAVVTTMEFDAINKNWVDRETKATYTNIILFWQPLRPYKSESEMRLKEDDPKCSFCGWRKSDHRSGGRCYHYSDESEDYFYSDRFFKA